MIEFTSLQFEMVLGGCYAGFGGGEGGLPGSELRLDGFEGWFEGAVEEFGAGGGVLGESEV